MTEKTKKRFGVWMDAHQATVVACKPGATEFTVVGQAKNPGPEANSNENAAHNHEITLVQKYFKEIGRQLVNADEVHLTGTGTMQEQFKHYLAEQAQFKKTVVSESTSNTMSDKKLVEFVSSHFN
jgi:stalled ribosome rescue protein Dom34